MTVCTASMFFWVYDAQKNDLGPAIVAASDRKLTDSGLGISYQGSRFKGSILPSKKLVLVSGDITIHSSILRSLNVDIIGLNLTTLETANIVGSILSKYRMKEAYKKFLSPLNLDENSFFTQQRNMDPSLVIELTNQLQSHQIDAEVIVCGCDDGNEANLYRVDSEGQVTCHSDINFVSIGSGGIHSSAYFMTASYSQVNSYYRALYHTFVAKKRAEVDPYVGTITDMFVINRNNIWQVPENVITILESIYRDYLETQNKIPEDAERKLIEAEKNLTNQPTESVLKTSKLQGRPELADPGGSDETYSDEQTAARRDNAIRRALNTPPQPTKVIVGKGRRASRASTSKEPGSGET